MTRGPAAARPRPPYTTMSANPPASHHPPTGAPLPRSPQLPHKHIPLHRHRGGRSSDFFGVVLDSVSFCPRQTSTDGFKSVYNRLRCLHLAVPVFSRAPSATAFGCGAAVSLLSAAASGGTASAFSSTATSVFTGRLTAAVSASSTAGVQSRASFALRASSLRAFTAFVPSGCGTGPLCSSIPTTVVFGDAESALTGAAAAAAADGRCQVPG